MARCMARASNKKLKEIHIMDLEKIVTYMHNLYEFPIS